ncbi:hypothetical protein AUP68_11758 [Ilyonectria robusta]
MSQERHKRKMTFKYAKLSSFPAPVKVASDLGNALRNLLRPNSPSGSELPNVDHLRIPKNVVETRVTPRQCIAHLHLLEEFVSAKTKVTRWADHNMIHRESAWRFYVNMAVERMAKWFEASYELNLKNVTPPLDVLMVWHAFLQSPKEWDRFSNLARIDHHSWNWDSLVSWLPASQHAGLTYSQLSALRTTDTCNFEIPRDSIDIVRQIYPAPDLLELMDLSTSFFQSPNPDDTTEHLTHLYLHRKKVHSFKTPNRHLNIRFDFHEAVGAQLGFANRLLQYSWHRMYSVETANESQFGAAIERYKKFMSLIKFSSGSHSKEPLARAVPNLVPALDIDLVWRTHMLSPGEYRGFSNHNHGRLLEHRPSPHNAVSRLKTAGVYQHVFGEEYDLCLCWPCVDGRETRGFSPVNWSPRPTFDEERAAELSRRLSFIIEIPLTFSIKQCKKCGFHSRRGCKPGDAFNGPDWQVEPALQNPRIPVVIRNERITHRIPTPWARSNLDSSPGLRAIRAELGLPPVGQRTGPMVPPPRHQYRHIATQATPWARQLSFNSSKNKGPARALSQRSLHSAGSERDTAQESNYTHLPASYMRSPNHVAEAGPSTINRNREELYEGPLSDPDFADNVGSRMGIDVGLWMSGVVPSP